LAVVGLNLYIYLVRRVLTAGFKMTKMKESSNMIRLITLFVAILSIFSIRGTGQESHKLMTWKTEFTVRTHLLQEMHGQYDLRRTAIHEALQSKEDMLAYREGCRQRYLRLLGTFPQNTALNPQVTGVIRNQGYRIENVLFESRPKHHVAANLYLPEGEGPFPAVLIFCGHNMISKAAESYQRTAILFALNGFVALVVDPISQGEMVQFTDEEDKRILRGSTTEHTLLNESANLVGTGVVAYELYDNVRSLDYLLSRPEVDVNRVGCLGNSGGGTQTAYFVGFDERIKVAAPCSYIARRERNLELRGAADGCQHLPYEGRELLEIGDFLIMFAPKPLLILAGRYDFVDYTGTEQTAEELKSVYRVLDAPEKFELFTVDDGHGISKPKREAAVRWFNRWLNENSRVVIEPPLTVQSEQELNCTPGGQINAMFSDERNIQDFNLEMGRELETARKVFGDNHNLTGYQQQIKVLLNFDDQLKEISGELVGEEMNELFHLKKFILRTEGEIPLPCLVYSPTVKSPESRTVIYIMEEGKSPMAANDSIIESYMRQGDLLIIADLRGMGETSEREDANDWKYYNREYNNAMISLHLGKPIVGQRVTDLLTLIDFLGPMDSGEETPVHIVGSGAAGPVAIYGALFRPQVKAVRINNSIQSYLDILNYPMELDWYSYVIPNVLTYFDLPDLFTLRDDLAIEFQGEKPRIEDHTTFKNRKIL